MDLTTFLIQCLNSLQYGLLLFLVASGLTLIFGIMGVINLAHGSFYMVGAYLAFSLAPVVGSTIGGGFFATLLVGVVLAVLFGYFLEWAFFSFLYEREHLQQVLMTYGLILVFEELRSLLVGRSRRLKTVLLDQHVIAGIGNIYSDEILHASRLRHDRPSDSLTGHEITRLHAEIHRVLREAIEAGGSTLTDTQYVDIEGAGGWFQLSHRVYDRAGQQCLTCGNAKITRVVFGGRSTCFCPRCQR
jgi:ribosomal protein S13